MALALSSKKDILFDDIRTATALAAYLGDMSDSLKGVSGKQREAEANAFVRDNKLNVDNTVKAAELAGKLEADYKREIKAASLKTKMNHRFGEDAAKIRKVIALGAACAVGGVLAANGMGAASVPVLFAGLVATADDRKMSDKDKAAVEKYGEAKRALFALKKIKKALSAESKAQTPANILAARKIKRDAGR